MRPEVIADFGRKSRYFNTFGGNPVSCAAALATLEVIQDEGLVENARVVGSFLMDGLRDVARAYPSIGDVRGAGLFIGVELVKAATNEPDSALARQVVNGLRHRGVLIGATGPHANVLKIRPPLILSKEHASLLLEAVRDVFQGCVPVCSSDLG
jgi:4-aminobutyrate aminotransferase-like enzyme